MVLRVTAIRPAHIVIADPTRQLEALLGAAGFAGGMVRRMADYPPALPWTSRPPRTGPRAGGRRTGALGRGWRITRVTVVGDDIVSEVENRVSYGVWVQGPNEGAGPGQTHIMASRGWESVTDGARAEFDIWQPRIVRVLAQRDTPSEPL